MFRYQVAKLICVNYLYIKRYIDAHLRQLKISLPTYVEAVYTGAIWLDDIMISVIAASFKISISLISPYFTEAKRYLHNEPTADVVLITNGTHFHSDYKISQITPTMSADPDQKLVGFDLELGETLFRYTGIHNGTIAAKAAIHRYCEKQVKTEAQQALDDLE